MKKEMPALKKKIFYMILFTSDEIGADGADEGLTAETRSPWLVRSRQR